MNYLEITSPIGTLTLVENEGALSGVYLETHAVPPRALRCRSARLEQAGKQLHEYFAKERDTFDVTLRLEGTPFQRSVWAALAQIPFGSTCSYAELARRIGRPSAVRAVGAANGANRISIIVPCHRVIGADGSLAGYGGGLPRKRWLLAHEDLERSSPRAG